MLFLTHRAMLIQLTDSKVSRLVHSTVAQPTNRRLPLAADCSSHALHGTVRVSIIMIFISDTVVLLDHAVEADAQLIHWEGCWSKLPPILQQPTSVHPLDAKSPEGCDKDECDHELHAACTDAGRPTQTAATQQATQEPACSNKRKRRGKGKQLSQEELDAKHPGNARNRAAALHVACALQTWRQWLASQAAEMHSSDRTLLPPAISDMLTRKAQLPGSSASGKPTEGADANSSAQEGEPVCWRSLYAERATLHPKAAVLGPVANVAQAEALMQQVLLMGRDHHTTQPNDTCGHDGCEDAVQRDTASTLDAARATITNLYHAVVANPHPCEALALAFGQPILMPPQSRFCMGDIMARHGLAPLLAAREYQTRFSYP